MGVGCEHDWGPLLQWSGRYRCSKCGALGYRGLVCGNGPRERAGTQAAWQAQPDKILTIISYRCNKTVSTGGERHKCGLDAVTKHKGVARCHAHREDR